MIKTNIGGSVIYFFRVDLSKITNRIDKIIFFLDKSIFLSLGYNINGLVL